MGEDLKSLVVITQMARQNEEASMALLNMKVAQVDALIANLHATSSTAVGFEFETFNRNYKWQVWAEHRRRQLIAEKISLVASMDAQRGRLAIAVGRNEVAKELLRQHKNEMAQRREKLQTS